MFTSLALVADFRFNPFALLSLIALVTNLSLFILIQVKGVKNQANNWFSLLLAASSLWSLSELLDRSSATATGSLFWDFVGRPGWVFFAVILFGFILHFVGKEGVLKKLRNQILIFGPALIFMFLIWNTNLIANNTAADNHPVYWGWSISPIGDYFDILTAWTVFYLLLSVGFLARFYFKASDLIKRKQALLIIGGVLITIIGALITDAIAPLIGVKVVPVATVLVTLMNLSFAYSIIHYSLFVVNPTLAASTIVENMSDSLMVIRPNRLIEQVNQATLNLLGYKRDEIIGANIARIFPSASQSEGFLKEVFGALKEKPLLRNLETEFKTKENKIVPISFSAVGLKDIGGLVGIVGLARDITETKDLILNLTAERNKLSVALSGVTDGVFVLDKEGKIVLVNQSMEKILGYGTDELINKKVDNVLTIYENEEKISGDDLMPKDNVAEDRLVASKKDIRVKNKEGRDVFVNLTSSTIAEGESVDLGAIVTLHDVSKEHELEEMKLDFVSMAAHELRTPLTTIRGYISLLEEDTKGKLTKQQSSDIHKIFVSSTQLASLIENLLAVSRIERGFMKVEKTPVDWTSLVKEVLANFVDQAKERKVNLSFVNPSKKTPTVLADRFRIAEVLSNLIDNAINHTPEDGKVEVSIRINDGQLVTQVKDTGEGIPKEALPNLFTKFFRVSGSLEQGSKGTGLGLYISKAIIDMHEGKISVESTVGKGSNFTFSLRIASDEEIKKQKSELDKFKEMGLTQKSVSHKKEEAAS